jgi:ubiquilin
VYAGGVLSQPIATVEAGMGRKPNTVERLGTTTKTEAEVQQFLRSISSQWTAQNYDLWEHNCNNFSERVAQFLCGTSIPRWILDFPREMRSTPLGQMLAPMLGTSQDALNGQLGTSGYVAPATAASAPAPAPPAPGDAMAVTVKPATGSAPPRTLAMSKTATVGDLRKALGVDSAPRFVFMGKLLADDSKTLASYGVADGLTVLQVAGRGSPVTSPAPAAAAAPTTATTPLAASIARAEASGGVDVLRTLHRILSNIVQHPTEAKYRQLKTTNAAFQRKCLNHDGARDVLVAAGFVENDGVLTMTPSAQAYPVLTSAERALSARLDAIEAAARGPPAAPGMPDLSALMGGGGMPGLGMGGAGMGNVMQELQRNPVLMQQVQRLMSDPAAMQRAMETIQRNPQLAQMMAQRMQGGGGMPDPATMARMMQDPAVQAQMRQLQASLGGGMGMPPPMGGMGGGAGPDPGALAAALAGLNNGTGGAAPAPQANNVNENGDAMSEEEAIQEAIRRSMREQ